jgi:hypothetical protein
MPRKGYGRPKGCQVRGELCVNPHKITNMAQLTPEEIAKIDEEERLRAEAQLKHFQPKKIVKTKIGGKPMGLVQKISIGYICFLVLLVIIGATISAVESNKSEPSNLAAPETSVSKTASTNRQTYPLNAGFKYSNLMVEITNNNNFDWTNCELVVNYDAGYYEAKVDIISPNKPQEYMLNDFVKLGSSERFNPYTEAIRNFSINCQTPNGAGFVEKKIY